MRLLAIVIACVVAISGVATGAPRKKGAVRKKPGPKPAAPAPKQPAAPPTPDEPPAPAPASTTPDVRKTLEKVTVRKQPGEKQAAVATLPAGTEVIVQGEQGRWLRVRAGKVSGYLARTTVSDPPVPSSPVAPPSDGGTAGSIPEPADPDAQEAQGAQGAPKTWGRARQTDPAQAPSTELFVEVAASSSELRAEARPGAASVARVSRGTRLAVVEVDDAAGWLRARDDAGRTGWIARDQVRNSAAGAVSGDLGEAAATRAVARADAPDPRASRRLAVRVDAGIGYRTLGMELQSSGGDGLANYLVDAGAGAADLDLELVLRPTARWRFAVDGRLQLSRLSPGLAYDGPTAPPGKIAFSTFAAGGGVRAGRRMGPAFELWLRAGGHYDAFVATDVENAGRLPRERLLGATAGARADVAPPRSRITASLWADALVLGSRRQTPGLEDGADSTVRAVWAGATLRFRIGTHLSILGAYEFGRATTRWSGMSVRQPGATDARRTDGSQLVQIGIGAEM